MERSILNTNKQRESFWQELVHKTSSEEFRNGLSAIDPISARVLKWHYMEGYSLQEIVQLLGKSISIVRNHHNRGIFELQKYFIESEKKDFNSAHSS
jgi:DNA-directed RNA polymerase specialized sigma24 family protein